jgi:alkane 1-monooxygenase
LILWSSLPLQSVVLMMALRFSQQFSTSDSPFWAIAISCGISAGAFGITAAHELIHRVRRIERGLGIGNLLLCAFTHFRVEHVFVHHRHVGTAKDTVTARLGESVYTFLVRSLFGGYIETAKIELKKGLWNRFTRDQAAQLSVLGLIAWTCGEHGLILFAVQSAVAWSLLGIVNYLEHYGLERRVTTSGALEAFSEKHSWESRHRFTNAALFNLGLHSSHHLAANRPYQKLEAIPGSPQLPWGYSLSLVIALIPPLWRRVMDPLALQAMQAPQQTASDDSTRQSPAA